MQTRPVWHLVPRYNCPIARIDNMLRNRMFPGIDVAPFGDAACFERANKPGLVAWNNGGHVDQERFRARATSSLFGPSR
jgi:hypothetical protein